MSAVQHGHGSDGATRSGLRGKNVDFIRKALLVRQEKGQKDRVTRLPDEVPARSGRTCVVGPVPELGRCSA
jgi:hypothetical protein